MREAHVPQPCLEREHCAARRGRGSITVAPGFLPAPFLRLPPRSPPIQSRRTVTRCCTASGIPPGINVSNVSFWWKNGRRALADINLEVVPGELAMIVGSNGCGKSTLLRTVRGLLKAGSGSVSLESPCAFVYQNPATQIVMPTIGLDVAASIREGPGVDVRGQVFAALSAVGLQPPDDYLHMSSHRLSGGQRQRVVVAAALVREPRTILFDEVTASMDAVNKADLVQRVRNIVTEKKIAALWVTHLLDELDFADTIIIMKDGRIAAKGPRVIMMPAVYEMQDMT